MYTWKSVTSANCSLVSLRSLIGVPTPQATDQYLSVAWWLGTPAAQSHFISFLLINTSLTKMTAYRTKSVL